jgi:hypothetical protein
MYEDVQVVAEVGLFTRDVQVAGRRTDQLWKTYSDALSKP